MLRFNVTALAWQNPGYIPESESPYREFQHKATASTSKGLRLSCRTWKVLTRAHDWQPLPWLAGVETATAPLENRVTVSTNAAHRPTPGCCPSTPVCTQKQAHTGTKRQLRESSWLYHHSPNCTQQTVHQQQSTSLLQRLYNGILLGDEKGQTTGTNHHVGDSQRNNDERDEEHILCDATYMKFQRVQMIYGSGSNQG